MSDLAKRCRAFEECLPDAEYRTRLKALHDEMLAAVSSSPVQAVPQRVEPCPKGDARPESTCTNRHQCWEPCGELGNSAEHVVAGRSDRNKAVSQGEASPLHDGRFVTIPRRLAFNTWGLLSQRVPCAHPDCRVVSDALTDACYDEWQAVTGAALAAPSQASPPTDMVLFCSKCGVQHVDSPEKPISEHDDIPEWTNPPHRSHLCHGCGHIWRPADVPTNGVVAVKTKGSADSELASPPPGVMQMVLEALEQTPFMGSKIFSWDLHNAAIAALQQALAASADHG